MAAYNGHRSWNSWNVSLWINNDESLYRLAYDLYEEAKRKYSVDSLARLTAARHFMAYVEGEKTPDGAKYNKTCVFEAMEGMI